MRYQFSRRGGTKNSDEARPIRRRIQWDFLFINLDRFICSSFHFDRHNLSISELNLDEIEFLYIQHFADYITD